MTPVLPLEPARSLCLSWMKELDSSELGRSLRRKDCGRMLGILTCTDGTVYRAFSGLLNGCYTYEGFVGPCFDVGKVQNLLREYDGKIKATDDRGTKKSLSKECFEKLCTLYRFTCFDGKTIRLSDISTDVPAGTGDCCAPRLLSRCFRDGKKPVSMCEFFYGDGTQEHLSFHSPCDERCKPILKHIIGLDVIYLDEHIVVVHKPSGLLAIEGRTEDKKDCVASRVRNLYRSIQQPCVHRLDQATSGLMVLGLTQQSHNNLCLQFERREVEKTYEALIEGKLIAKEGKIELPIRLDTDNRPHQIVDFEKGKSALTYWENMGIKKKDNGFVTRLRLIPHTGRTHQLRIHCSEGLGHPIVGDRLYGNGDENSKLCLQAVHLEFTHPVTGQRMAFTDSLDF